MTRHKYAGDLRLRSDRHHPYETQGELKNPRWVAVRWEQSIGGEPYLSNKRPSSLNPPCVMIMNIPQVSSSDIGNMSQNTG